jgi:hypothetical protein
LKRAGEDIPEAKGLLVCRWFVVGLSLVCRWFVVGLSLVCRWFVVALSLLCRCFVVALSMLKPLPTKSAFVFLWVL